MQESELIHASSIPLLPRVPRIWRRRWIPLEHGDLMVITGEHQCCPEPDDPSTDDHDASHFDLPIPAVNLDQSQEPDHCLVAIPAAIATAWSSYQECERVIVMGLAIHVEGLVKRYRDIVALDHLDLSVEDGTILGLLGPNGAGKTTAVRILSTLLEADGGRVEVAGIDVRANPEEVRRRIGLSGQSAAVDEVLTGFENLDMVGRLYRLGRHAARARATELLERFGLTAAANRPVKTYSGGMRRRLDLAAALVAAPQVLFLDEPSTGLDPRSRNELWDLIRELVQGGATLLLTTQYLEEADRLADDIVVINHGKAIAQGHASALKAQVGGERIEIVLTPNADLATARRVLSELAIGEVTVEEHTRRLTAAVANGSDALRLSFERFESAGITYVEFGLRRPTLDDVFLTLTGHTSAPDAQFDQSTVASESTTRGRHTRERNR